MCRPASSIAAPFRRCTGRTRPTFPSTVRGICKRVFQPTRGEMVPLAVRQAWKTMVTGRPGPVVLDVPYDVFMESAAEEAPDAQGVERQHFQPLRRRSGRCRQGCRHAARRGAPRDLCRPGDPPWRRGRRTAPACRASANSGGGFDERARRDRYAASALAGNGGARRPLSGEPRHPTGRRAAVARRAFRRPHVELVDPGLLLHHPADTSSFTSTSIRTRSAATIRSRSA